MFHKSVLKQLNYKVLPKGHFVSFKWNNNKINPRGKKYISDKSFYSELNFICPVDTQSLVNWLKADPSE